MFSVEELLSKKNQTVALAHFKTKRDSCGPDKMRVSELDEYWNFNKDFVCNEIKQGTYTPGVIHNYEIVNNRGKRRIISNINVLDRFIVRLISQKLKRYLEPEFHKHSYAYQENKGVLAAVQQALEYIRSGMTYVVKIDIKAYFDTISLDTLYNMLTEKISDQYVLKLIYKFLYCNILYDGEIKRKTSGLVQGSSMSPVLSNLYLSSLDDLLETNHYQWIRFADDISVYTKDIESASEIYGIITDFLAENLKLAINTNKSGIFKASECTLLGYEFYNAKGKIEIRKRNYQPVKKYSTWHSSALYMVNKEYHIVQNGILNKKDYALLFENEQKKHHIPIEATEQINFYSDIVITTNVLRTLSQNNIRASFFDKYGNMIGQFVPDTYFRSSEVLLKQCTLYNDVKRRLYLAKRLELAAVHNIKANLKYYKKRHISVENELELLGKCQKEMELAENIESLMILEAKARQVYYETFDKILAHTEFVFDKRTKKPPENELNSMISFGNTMLYNFFLTAIHKTALEPHIGIVHATNRRNYSLNLDFADLFKPIIVDRIIFSLINKQMIKKKTHFESNDDKGVYLNRAGKYIMVEAFEEKLQSKINVRGKQYTYRKLMEQEVYHFYEWLVGKGEYKPYKYY